MGKTRTVNLALGFHAIFYIFVLIDLSSQLTIPNPPPNPNLKVSPFQKHFRRKLDPGPKRVQIFESGTRPQPPSGNRTTIPKLIVGAPEIINDGLEVKESISSSAQDSLEMQRDDASSSSKEENIQGQDSFFSMKEVVPALKSIRTSAANYAIGKPTRPTSIYYRPTTFRPTLTTFFPPLQVITNRPQPIDPIDPGTDFGTFPPEETSPTPPPTSFATIVPILGGGGGGDGNDIFPPAPPSANLRSLLGSRRRTPVVGSTIPKRRIVGSENLRTTSREVENVARDIEDDADVITDFMFSDIKCFRTRQKEYFGAKVHLKSGFHLPYIRDRPEDPLSSSSCRMERTDSTDSYHMKISDLRACGVEQCGNDAMCLTMVFPRVPMLALADDEVTTIKCTPQRSTMSETRTISFSGDPSESRRSSSTVEGGGQEFAAEVGVFRQNSGTKNGLFVKRVNSGGVVQLGEPLQLRSVIRGGDGWTYSRLTDVKVWRMRDSYSHKAERLNPNDASEVITLVDPNGCRNSDYRVISDSHPLRDPRNDLVHHFNFKAFLFRGQRASEPLIITAKVQACQDRDDCDLVDCSDDADLNFERRTSRFKRSPTELNSSSIIHDWSQMVYRVDRRPGAIEDEDFNPAFNLAKDENDDIGIGRSFGSYSCEEKIIGFSATSSILSLILCSLIFACITVSHRNRFRRNFINSSPKESKDSLPPNSILKRRSPTFHPDFIWKSSKRNGESQNFSNSANKPLPELPLTRNSGRLSSTQVSQLLRQVSTQNLSSTPPAEYECISQEDNNSLKSDETSGSSKTDDDVYIVYRCNREGSSKKRSRSAPASLREKKNKKFMNNYDESDVTALDDDEEEDSDSFPPNNNLGMGIRQNGYERRTVRSVKMKSNHNSKHRLLKSKLNAIYGKCGDHGSFPVRMTGKRNAMGGGSHSCRVTRRYPHANEKLHKDDFFNQFSASDLDSAYSGSISSKLTTGSSVQQENIGGVVYSTDAYVNPTNTPYQNSNTNNFVSPETRNGNKSVVSFVTRNDSSTQIIVIPETNV